MSRMKFESPFAPYILDFINKKKTEGFVYQNGQAMLHLFDMFCVERGFSENHLTQELIDEWEALRPGERKRYQSQRVTYLRQLATHMLSMGINTPIPRKLYKESVPDLRTRVFTSALAPFIRGLIAQKRANGYKYNNHVLVLYQFDQFCISRRFCDEHLPRELVMGWLVQRPGEGTKARNERVSCIRNLARYMISLGKDAYIPKTSGASPTAVPHILTKEQLRTFFFEVDNFEPDYRSRDWMAMAYSVLFRLFYCCGLRLQEGCRLRVADVDLETGQIKIFDSKRKDRIVIMSEDMLALCRNYDRAVRLILPMREWFFSSTNRHKPLHKTNMDRRFKYFWDKTPYAGNVDRTPTIHALRHTFVVHRINDWMWECGDFQQLLPCLTQYLGHKSFDETYYYYHLAVSAFDIIRKNDVVSSVVIPEVQSYED